MPASTAKANPPLSLILLSDREIQMTRVFDAPRRLVFEAWSKPEHLLRWFGPRSCPLVECTVDFRPGGAWRFLLRGPDGRPMGMRGVYQEIQPFDRLVSTESFDDYPGESLNTMTLTEKAGKTTLVTRVLYPSKEIRDAVIASGIETGAAETYERLAEHLRTMAETSLPELAITRIFDAPRELVFDCWTNPEHLQHWQGAPVGFTVTSSEADIRPGGFFRICMRSPEGQDHWLEGGYREIVPPERLVFTHAWLEGGRKGKETVVTVTLNERGGKTELMLRQSGFDSVKTRDGHMHGWNSALDVLAAYVNAGDSSAQNTMVMTRVFNAPRELVFKAWTDPERLKRWWGPKGFTNPVCDVDARPGGAILIHMRAPDGVVHVMTGVYEEVAEPERLVFVSSALDQNGQPLFQTRNTITFADEGGKTKLTVQAIVSNVRPEAAPHLAGMEMGWSMTLDRLAEEVTA